jgi:hypothetical protein
MGCLTTATEPDHNRSLEIEMAINTVQPGTAPANPVTHEQLVEFLASYTVNGDRAFQRPDANGLNYFLGDLEGLLAFVAAALTDATDLGEESSVRHLDPNNLIGTMKSARRLAALAVLMTEAM